jgi:hypothetical protein
VQGHLVRTSRGQWITKPPSRCPNGHALVYGPPLNTGSRKTRLRAGPRTRPLPETADFPLAAMTFAPSGVTLERGPAPG